jgi:uncharacterized membrane protein
MSLQVVNRPAPAARRTGAAPTVRIVLGALAGAVGGLAVTAAALRSLEAGIFGAVAGALAVMVGTLVRFERPDV